VAGSSQTAVRSRYARHSMTIPAADSAASGGASEAMYAVCGIVIRLKITP
jgi:hypothetical protein